MLTYLPALWEVAILLSSSCCRHVPMLCPRTLCFSLAQGMLPLILLCLEPVPWGSPTLGRDPSLCGGTDEAPRAATCRKAPRGVILGTRAQWAGISFTLICCVCGALSTPCRPCCCPGRLGAVCGLGSLAELSMEHRVTGEDPPSPPVEVIALLVEWNTRILSELVSVWALSTCGHSSHDRWMDG